MISANDMVFQDRLKMILQGKEPGVLERLASALIENLLGVTVAVARGGFQHGGDAGPAGRQGRRFRIEAKRYADATPLSDRELCGEMDHALRHDPALEAWILVATREVSEQVEGSLHGKGDSIGVPVVVIDWKPGGISLLAALCSSSPTIVGSLVTPEAEDLVRSIQPAALDRLEMLQRDLQAWCLGFESIRSASHEFLRRIWSSPTAALAKLGQNAAVGAKSNRLVRRWAHGELDGWWNSTESVTKPVAVIGFDGVGKTWAVVDWLTGRLDDLPVVIAIPASAVDPTNVSLSSVKGMLAGGLHGITGVRDPRHWLRRLELLLKTPPEEGPVLTILLDGMNQQPSIPWIDILAILQDEPFAGRLRVIVTTRKHHFEDKLAHLRRLIDTPRVVGVDIYDDGAGGELDQMLAFENLTRDDLHQDLIPLARTPRLFNLVVKFRDGLVAAGQVTTHRLLWEYGRHTFGDLAGRSFSEDDWQAWLQDIARNQRKGVTSYTAKTLGEMSNRPDLLGSEVYARLSEIIDGQFVTRGNLGEFIIKPALVSHALGAALLFHLDGFAGDGKVAVFGELDSWLDPISGMDQRAEILRASVSILIERGSRDDKVVGGALLTAWLQTQNLPDEHRDEVCRLAAELVFPLLVALKESPGRAQSSVRYWVLDALAGIPRNDVAALEAIVAMSSNWLLVISRDVRNGIHDSGEWEIRRSNRLSELIGEDRSGPREILGKQVQLVDQPKTIDLEIIPNLLEGFPLSGAVSVFEAAALQLAVRGTCDSWQGLKWLFLLNSVDALEARSAIRGVATAIAGREVEAGIDCRLGQRIASLMLRLSGEKDDEEAAELLEPGIDRHLTYENDYLPNPGKSLFALEWRHADEVLRDKKLSLSARLHRTREFWLDPTFVPPPELADELRDFALSFSVGELDAHRSQSREDIDFREIEPVLARCVPDELASLIRRKIRGYTERPPEARYWSAVHASDHSLLIDDECVSALRALRESECEVGEDDEFFAVTSLLMMELIEKPALEQITMIIGQNLKHILVDWVEILEPLSAEDGEELITRYRAGTVKQQTDLVLVLSEIRFSVGDGAWSWLVDCAMDLSFPMRHVACDLLVRTDAARFGRHLQALNWSWTPGGDVHIDHYCTQAIIAASMTTPFEQVAPRLVPWLVTKALTIRGGDVSDSLLAAEIFGSILMVDTVEVPDLGSKSRINQNDRSENPFSISIEIPPPKGIADDHFSDMAAAMDPEGQAEIRKRAVKLAIERINQARSAGASFYLTSFDPRDLKELIRHAPQQVERWLDGMDSGSESFSRRVRLAEGAYLALCEALLDLVPERGAVLWRALRKLLHTRFIGIGQVDELVHLPFRVPQSSATDGVLAELIDFTHANTDAKLLDLVIAAQTNGRREWLDRIIADDLESPTPWRMKRAVVLGGFLADGGVPNEKAWPEGGFCTAHEELLRRSARAQWSDSCAQHWWSCYVGAMDPVSAYSAWVLFLRTVDRRARNWLRSSEMKLESEMPLVVRNSHSDIPCILHLYFFETPLNRTGACQNLSNQTIRRRAG